MLGAIFLKLIVKRAIKAINRHELSAFMQSFAEEAVFIYPKEVKVGGIINGKSAITLWFKRWMQQFTKSHFTIKHLCLENPWDIIGTNFITVEWKIKITNKDSVSAELDGITTIQTKLGKAVVVRDYIDNTVKLKQIWGET